MFNVSPKRSAESERFLLYFTCKNVFCLCCNYLQVYMKTKTFTVVYESLELEKHLSCISYTQRPSMCRVNTWLNAKQQHVKENMITRCLNITVESLHLIVNIIFPEMEGCYNSMVFLNAKKKILWQVQLVHVPVLCFFAEKDKKVDVQYYPVSPASML